MPHRLFAALLSLGALHGGASGAGVKLGQGELRVCGDHSDSNWMKYEEYAEYEEFALHIDIDTSMCGFTAHETPQYVANLMDESADGHKKPVLNPYIGKIAGSSSILRSSPTRFRVVVRPATSAPHCYPLRQRACILILFPRRRRYGIQRRRR